jgi:signal peptidase I
MLVDANAFTRWAADSLLTGSLHGAVVIALIWLASRHIPNVPASVQAALWWLAALKLLLTLLPVPALSIPLLPAEAHSTALQANLPASEITAGTSVSVATDRSAAGLHRGPATDGGRVSRWLVALIGVWFLGLALQAIRLVMALRTLRAVVRRSVSPVAEDTALVAQLADIIGLTCIPQVRASGEIDTPQLAGVHRPIVLVPAAATAALMSDERAMALCHELMHIRRHDLALGWVPALAEHLFFFHPLARLAAREYVTAREAACDAAVVRALGVSPKDYGRLLVRVGVAGSVSAFAVGGASPAISSLRRRLEMLQHVGATTVSRRSISCIATVMFVAMMPFQLVARAPSDQATAPAAPISEASGDRVRVPAVPQRVAVASPAPRVGRVTPPEAVASALPATLQSAVPEPSDRDAIRQVGDAASVEQQAIEERRQALEELRKKLVAEEEAMRKSLLDERPDIQALRAQLEAVQRSLNERTREAVARAMTERQDRELRLRALHEQLEHLAREQRTLIRQQQGRTLEQERLAAAQRQLSAAAHAQSDTYSRGEIVTLAPAADGTRPPNSRVLAVAGDRVQVARAGIVVNGVRVTDVSSDFLAGLPEDTWEKTVPRGYYFVAAEQRSESDVSRYWGLIPAERITGRP